jgi:hypothetical protein
MWQSLRRQQSQDLIPACPHAQHYSRDIVNERIGCEPSSMIFFGGSALLLTVTSDNLICQLYICRSTSLQRTHQIGAGLSLQSELR